MHMENVEETTANTRKKVLKKKIMLLHNVQFQQKKKLKNIESE